MCDADGNLALKECVSRGLILLAEQALEVVGADRLWTRLGRVAWGHFHELVPWGTTYPYASPEIDVSPNEIGNGYLTIEIFEDSSLAATAANWDGYGIFRCSLQHTVDHHRFRLELDRDGKPRGFCWLDSRWCAMEFIPWMPRLKESANNADRN